MAVYAPLFYPGDSIPRVTSAAVTAGQLVYVSGNDTIAPTSAATVSWLGVASQDDAGGGQISVYTEGVHVLAASGTINAGDVVVPAAAGAVAAIGAGVNYAQVVGVALSAAASSLVKVQLRA
jgi:hypothetical protein